MQRILQIGVALLVAVPGMAETIFTAEDYAVDSDVVLESAVKEIRSIPRDTVNFIGDGAKFLADETTTAAEGIASLYEKDEHAQTRQDGLTAVKMAWDSSSDILLRSYKVTEEVGSELMEGNAAEAGAAVDVSGSFMGMKFPKGTSIYYRPDFNRLFVRQTMDNILMVEDVLAEMHNASRELRGHQVEIETKFVEVSQSTLNELGFSWNLTQDSSLLDNLTLGATDLLTDGLRSTASALDSGVSAGVVQVAKTMGSFQWEMYISALEQSDDTDVLSAPRVVTRDGSTAIIQVGDEQMLPRAFDVSHSRNTPIIEPTDWELELVGVTMEVTPELREGGLIDLELLPKVVDIIGYDSYLIQQAHYNDQADESMDALYGTVPYLRIRELETRVTVADGNTVGMGGMIYDKVETYRDKVPVLGSIPYVGRLFRSEGERSIKRNLMIFVTASEVDINGRSTQVVLNK
jgi:general secretion pathway protein D